MRRSRVCFVVESGTDVRMVEGLAAHCDLAVIARRIVGGVEISRTPRESIPTDIGPAGRIRFALHVFRAVLRRRDAFDFVLVQGYGPAAVAANLAARITGLSSAMLICSPTEAYYRCRREAGTLPFRRLELAGLLALARINARLGERYIVLSDHLGDVVRGHGTRAPVDVVPVYGVDTTIFHPPAGPMPDLRRQRGLPEQGALLFFSSRVAPEKDASTLLSAFGELRRQGRDVYLLHRSGGFRDFVALAREFGVDDRVIATDAVHPQRELPADYWASDVCVQASREEGLGYSVLEALACETPVVATHVGGLVETIVDGVTGWSYPVGDAPALARCLAAALDDRGEALRRARAGSAMVKERFESKQAFASLSALIDAAVARRAER